MCRVLQFRSLAVYYTWTRLRNEAREHALMLLSDLHFLIHFGTCSDRFRNVFGSFLNIADASQAILHRLGTTPIS